MFSRFDTVHTCDGQTELAWHIRAIAYMQSRVKTDCTMRVGVSFSCRPTWPKSEIHDTVWLLRLCVYIYQLLQLSCMVVVVFML